MGNGNFEENRAERAQKFAMIWSRSRTCAGKSQEYMALGLGVSKKTVQNWEKGISSPTFFQGTEWFHLLGMNPLPYYYDFLFSNEVHEKNSPEELHTNEALTLLIEQLPLNAKQELLFMLSGEHGSSPYSMIQLMTAHLQSPLKDRVSHANIIMQDYEMEKELGQLSVPDAVQPDLEVLRKAITEGRQSVMTHGSGYTIMEQEE